MLCINFLLHQSLSPFSLYVFFFFFLDKWIIEHLFVTIHREFLVACNDQEKKLEGIKVVDYIRLENLQEWNENGEMECRMQLK